MRNGRRGLVDEQPPVSKNTERELEREGGRERESSVRVQSKHEPPGTRLTRCYHNTSHSERFPHRKRNANPSPRAAFPRTDAFVKPPCPRGPKHLVTNDKAL